MGWTDWVLPPLLGPSYWLLPDKAKDVVKDVVDNAVVKKCTLINNTIYKINIDDWDGARVLLPGHREENYLVRGSSGIALKMEFSQNDHENKFFTDYDGSEHYMGEFFKKEIEARQVKVKTKSVIVVNSIGYMQIGTIPAHVSKSTKVEVGWTSNDKTTETNEKTEKMSFEISAEIPIQGVPLTPKIGGEKGSKQLTEIMSSMQMEYKSTVGEIWESHDKHRDVFSIVIQGKMNEDTDFVYVHPGFVITTEAGEEAPKLTWEKLRNMIL